VWVNVEVTDWIMCKKEKTTQAVRSTPCINSGKGPFCNGYVTLLHQEKTNGDQKGCRLDLKPTPDES